MTTDPAIIGTLTIPAGTIRNASYETAAWYTIFDHPAQTVEVRLVRNLAVYAIEGRTTHEHFPSLYGGVPTGGGTMGPCDKPARHTVCLYDYQAAALAEAGTLHLADGYELQATYFDHPVSCMGYSTEYTDGKARYLPCAHDVHEDAHYRPTVTERNARGHLPFGYAPGVKNRKRHIKIVPAALASEAVSA